LYRYAHVTHAEDNVSIKKIQEELHHNYSRTLIMQIYSWQNVKEYECMLFINNIFVVHV